MKKIIISFFLILVLFLYSCGTRDSELETFIEYIEKDNKEVAELIRNWKLDIKITYQDNAGNIHILTEDKCIKSFSEAGYNEKTSREICKYIFYKAYKSALKEKTNPIEMQLKLLVEDYKNYIKEKENTLETIKKIAIYSIPVFFGLFGLIVGFGVYRIIGIEQKEREIDNKFKQAETALLLYKQQKEQEANQILLNAKREASNIITKAKADAEHIKQEAYEKAYIEGQEKHKKELKTLRDRIAAIKGIFRSRSELNECFKKQVGYSFEEWLNKK